MTKYYSSDIGGLASAGEFDFEDAENYLPPPLKVFPSFRDAAFLNGKMLEKMRAQESGEIQSFQKNG